MSGHSAVIFGSHFASVSLFCVFLSLFVFLGLGFLCASLSFYNVFLSLFCVPQPRFLLVLIKVIFFHFRKRTPFSV